MAKDDIQVKIELVKEEYLAGLITIQEAQKKWQKIWVDGEKGEQKEVDKTTDKIKKKTSALKKLYIAYLAVTVVVYKVIRAFQGMVIEAVAFIRAEGQLRIGAQRLGVTLQSLKRIISEEKGGMFSQADVKAAVAYAAANGVTADKIKALIPLVRDSAALFGDDLTEGIKAVTSALKGGDVALLKRMGVQISQKQLDEASIEIFGKKISKLSSAQKEEVLYSEIIEQLNGFLGAENDLLDTNIGKLGEQEAAMADLRVEIGERLIPVKTMWYNLFNYFLQGINKVIEGWEYLIGLVFDYEATRKRIMEEGESPEEKRLLAAQEIDKKKAELADLEEERTRRYKPGYRQPTAGINERMMTGQGRETYYANEKLNEQIQLLRMEIEARENEIEAIDAHTKVLDEQGKRFDLGEDKTIPTIPGGGGKAEKLPKTIEDYIKEFDDAEDALRAIWQMQDDIGEELDVAKDYVGLWRGQLVELVEAGYQFAPLYMEIATKLNDFTDYIDNEKAKQEALDRDMKALQTWIEFSKAGYAHDPTELYPPPDPEHKHPEWYMEMVAKGKKKELEAEHMRSMRNSLATVIPNILIKGFTDMREALRMFVQNMGTVLGDLVAGPGIPSFGESMLGAGIGAVFGLMSTMIGGGGGNAWGEGGAVPVNVVEFLGQRDPFPLPSSAYFTGDRGGTDINVNITGGDEGLASAVQQTVESYYDDQRRGDMH